MARQKRRSLWMIAIVAALAMTGNTRAETQGAFGPTERNFAERAGHLLVCSAYFMILTNVSESDASQAFARSGELLTFMGAMHLNAAAGEAFSWGEIKQFKEKAFVEFEESHRSGSADHRVLTSLDGRCIAWQRNSLSFAQSVGEAALRESNGIPSVQRTLLSQMQEPTDLQIDTAMKQLGHRGGEVI